MRRPPTPPRRTGPTGPLGGALPSRPLPGSGLRRPSGCLTKIPPGGGPARCGSRAQARRTARPAQGPGPLPRRRRRSARLGGAQDVDQEFPRERRGLDLPRQEVSVGGACPPARPSVRPSVHPPARPLRGPGCGTGWDGTGRDSPAGRHQLRAARGSHGRRLSGGGRPPCGPGRLLCRVSPLLAPIVQRVRRQPAPGSGTA